jgi:hypothetical protein
LRVDICVPWPYTEYMTYIIGAALALAALALVKFLADWTDD